MKGKNLVKTVDAKSKQFAQYFGLTVEVVARMDSYSLIRWDDRSFIVETEDLHRAAMLAA
jgi:hypothetical protein